MSDVLQDAQKYRHRLKTEIAKVDEFLRFAGELTWESVPEPYTPLASAAPTAMPPEPQAEEPPRPAIDKAATAQAEANSASSKFGRASLFRGAFEPCELDRKKIVA